MGKPPKHSAQDVIDFIKNEKPRRNPTYYQDNHLDYYNAARRRKELGSWKIAFEKADADYYASLKRKWQSDSQIEDVILKRIALGRNVNDYHIKHYYPAMYGLIQTRYGSHQKLIEKCGKKYNRILKYREWSNDDIVFDIISAEQKNIDISGRGLLYYDTGLYAQAIKRFDNHDKFPFISNYDWTLVNCGINPESVRTLKRWHMATILYDVRGHIRQKRGYDWLRNHGKHDLVEAIHRHAGGFKRTVKLIGIFEEQGLFEKLDIFKQIENYRKLISGLRDVSMEGRLRVKRNRSYVMNLDKHTKPIRLVTLKRNLKTLEDYLSDVDELKTGSQIHKDTNIKKEMLRAATPTQTVDCMRSTDLINELDKKYAYKGWKYFGPKPQGPPIYYYLRSREEELKEKWAREHMANGNMWNGTRTGGRIR